MPFDAVLLKQTRERQCLAFCSVLYESRLVSDDLSVLLAKNDPPAAQSTIAAVANVRNSIKAIYLPPETAKLTCDLAFGSSGDYSDCMFQKCIEEQRRCYSRIPGKIVLQDQAKVGERVRESRYPHKGYHGWVRPRNLARGTITSLDCDHGSEMAVEWDDGTVSGNRTGGLKCGKKGSYRLVYD